MTQVASELEFKNLDFVHRLSFSFHRYPLLHCWSRHHLHEPACCPAERTDEHSHSSCLDCYRGYHVLAPEGRWQFGHSGYHHGLYLHRRGRHGYEEYQNHVVLALVPVVVAGHPGFAGYHHHDRRRLLGKQAARIEGL